MTDYASIATLLVQNPGTHAVNFDEPQDACGVFMELDRMYGPLIHNIDEYRRMNIRRISKMNGFRCVSRGDRSLVLMNVSVGEYWSGFLNDVTTVYRSGDFQAELDTTTSQLDLSALLGGVL